MEMLVTFDSDAEAKSANPTAQTVVRAGKRVELRMSNCDDQLLVWVVGKLVEFDQPTTYDSRSFRSGGQQSTALLASQILAMRRRSRLAFAVEASAVHSMRIDRDKYYIATNNANDGIYDYN